MWIHILSVATFLALGSCQNNYGFSRKQGTWYCKGPNCPCICPIGGPCPPCPTPEPIMCLSGCGTPECPCVNSNRNMRASGTQVGPVKHFAQALSTVNVMPTGPVCTAVNLKRNIVMTVSTCVAGIAVEDLYVTAVTHGVETLKVTDILAYPFKESQASPVLLVTKQSAHDMLTLVLPARPIDMTRTAEVHKWQVIGNGMQYLPMRTKAKSYTKCHTGEDLICAETYNTTVMGWNDIGSVLVELRDNVNWLQGMYMGDNLYNPTTTIKYISMYKYEEWLYSAIRKYS